VQLLRQQAGTARYGGSSGHSVGASKCGMCSRRRVAVMSGGVCDARVAVSIMRGEGAEVIQVGESWAEANEHALQLVRVLHV
jgi:hypothetical protein